MARLFDDVQDEYLQINPNAAVLNAWPATLAGWIYCDDDTNYQKVIALADASADTDRFSIQLTGGGGSVSAYVRTADVGATATSTAGFSENTWHHITGVFPDGAAHYMLLDGGNKGTAGAAKGFPNNVDATAIGRTPRSSGGLQMSGRIAWLAIWNVALTDAEVASLAAGVCPLLIRPESLVAFWPLGGLHQNNAANAANSDWDIVGGYHMDPINTPGVADHPGGLIYPSKPHVVVPAAAAPPAFVPYPYPKHELTGGLAL